MQEERLEAEHTSSTSYTEPGPAAPGAQINLNISGEEAFARRARQVLFCAGMELMATPSKMDYKGVKFSVFKKVWSILHLQVIQGTLWVLCGTRAWRPGPPS